MTMQMYKKARFFLLVALCVLLTGQIASAQTTYHEIKLPHGISIKLPEGWRFFNEFEQGAIEGYVDQLRDLSGYSSRGTTNKVLLMAHAMPRSDFAFVRVVMTVPGELRPKQVAGLSQIDLRRLTRKEMDIFKRHTEINILEYNYYEKTVVDGHHALIGKYRREGPLGPVRVIMNFVYTEEAAIKVTTSYRESEEDMWRDVIDTIISSIMVR